MRKIFIFVLTVLMITSSGITAFANTGELPEAERIREQIKKGDWMELAKIYDCNLTESQYLTSEKLAQWWKVFDDPTMTSLIMKALENNQDMASARAAVKESRAQLGITQADLLPWLDANGSLTNSRTSQEAGGGNARQFWGLGIDASWEIDVFGGKRATVSAQKASFEAQYAEMYSTWTSLAAEVAIDYISLRALQSQLDIMKHNVDLQQETVKIEKARVQSGLTDELSLKQAIYTLGQTRSSIPSIVASIERTKNALAILVGEVPGSLHTELIASRPIPTVGSKVLVGIPANAIRQRPDIRAAERNFVAQMARKKAAKADLWPKFYLTGAIGTEAHEGSLFNGSGKTYSFLPQISWPIFHAGAITRNIKAQGARAEQLLAIYEKTVLIAVGEVRDAISDSVQEYIRNMTLKNAMETAQAALVLAQEKYSQGLVDFTNVIDAQSALTSLSEQYVLSCGQISTNAVKLFKALGGGWQPLDEAERALAEAANKN